MSLSVIRVDVPGAAYDVTIGTGAIDSLGTAVSAVSEATMAALVTDETVGELFAMRADIALARAGLDVLSLTIPPGETSKNWAMAGDLVESMGQRGVSRNDVVVALGGGVVGDLAGFAAAVYQRGIDFVQVPTTLLAMVDSSVGGKTGVDLAVGKNMAGAFKQPLAVVADTALLASLPEDEWLSGLAEVAKSAILGGEEFTGWLEENAGALSRREDDAVVEAVRRCVEFKAGVVARDEKEEGPRECLNYGHTLGHALEKVLGYGTITHGAAVAEGMRFVARVAMQVGAATQEFVMRQDALLDALGLQPLTVGALPALLLEAMRSDKKSRARVVRMVLADGPGLWRCERVTDTVISQHLEAWAATKKG